MAIEIFKLFGSIFVDSSKAEESISKTESKAEKLAKNMGEGLKTAAKWGAGIAAGAGAALGGITALATKSAETTDRIDKMSHKIGISKQAFQEWDYIMGQNGMDVEKLQVGIKTLVSQMDAAEGGSKKATEAFGALGLTWEDGSGKLKSQEQMMNEAMMALANMENGTEKARLATELFGKAGVEMMPMLNGGAEAITELKDRSHELGLIMSDEAVNAGVVLGDTMDDVKDSFGAIFTKIGVEVMPIIQQLLDCVLANMPLIQEIVGKVFGFIGEVVGVAIDWIGKFIGWIKSLVEQAQTDGTFLNEIVTTIKDMFITAFAAIQDFFKSFFDFCKGFWDEWGDTITVVVKAIWDVVSSVFKTVFNLIMDIFKVFSALFKGDWKGLWEAVKNLFSNLWDGICNLFGTLLDGFISIFTNIVPKMIQVGKDIFSGLWDGIKGIWESISGWVSDKVSWLVDKLAFWKKGNDEMSSDDGGKSGIKTRANTNGSHANGLSYVPFDGYIGELHKGEEVVSKTDKQSILDILKALSLGNQGGGQIIELQVNLDGQKIARAIYNPMQKESKLQGNSFAMGV